MYRLPPSILVATVCTAMAGAATLTSEAAVWGRPVLRAWVNVNLAPVMDTVKALRAPQSPRRPVLPRVRLHLRDGGSQGDGLPAWEAIDWTGDDRETLPGARARQWQHRYDIQGDRPRHDTLIE